MVRDVVKMKDIQFEKGLPKGVNYMVIGDPGVGKPTIILDLLSDFSMYNSAKVLFVSAEMNEIDLAIYVQRFPKFQNLDILFVEGEFEQDSVVRIVHARSSAGILSFHKFSHCQIFTV